MTLKEFLEKNPAAVEEAAKCKSVAEFKKLADKVGITFDNQEKLEKAFQLVKDQHNGELSDDALDAVSGGYLYKHEGTIAKNIAGEAVTMGTYKKVK